MKVTVVGLKRKIVERELPKYGLELNKKNPEVVISFGGDGTALYAERVYPGVPRIMVRYSGACRKCEEYDLTKVLTALKEKKFRIIEETKVEGIVNNNPKKKLTGLNEVCIHHKIQVKVIRLRVKVNEKVIKDEVRGDGLVVATPYGSTAYFYSIARKKFSRGLGIAFSNPHERIKNLIVKDNSIIKAEIIRGDGLLTADNNERMITLKTGDIVTIKKSKGKARIIRLI